MAIDIELWHSLYDLEARYWDDVNRLGGAKAHEFYVSDGVFAVGKHRHNGSDAIREFYLWRKNRGARTARHLVSNFRIVGHGDGVCSGRGTICLFASDGEPILEAKPPALVADMTCECVLCDDGEWRFKSHILEPVFVGSDNMVSSALLGDDKKSKS